MNINNLQKYANVFKECFTLCDADLDESLVYQSIVTWDSVGHMLMVAHLEEAFDIMLDTDDIIDFSSYEKGKIILQKYDI